jgi:hypothetical protein
MSGSYTFSESQTFTLTSAKYLASRIAADLYLLHSYYNQPQVEWINSYISEAQVMMKEKVLGTVEYGFKKNGVVVLALKYALQWDGSLTNDKPGNVPYGKDLSGSEWYSWLEYGSKWSTMSEAERVRVRSELPFVRGTGASPVYGQGAGWANGHSYSRDGGSLSRSVYGS